MIDLKILLWIIICWNGLLFILIGVDKCKAIKGNYRIPERTLILSAFLFGWVGIRIGMEVFHHKIRKRSFKRMILIAFIFNMFIILLFLYLMKVI